MHTAIKNKTHIHPDNFSIPSKVNPQLAKVVTAQIMNIYINDMKNTGTVMKILQTPNN